MKFRLILQKDSETLEITGKERESKKIESRGLDENEVVYKKFRGLFLHKFFRCTLIKQYGDRTQ